MRQGKQGEILLVSSGDSRLSANQNCWAGLTTHRRPTLTITDWSGYTISTRFKVHLCGKVNLNKKKKFNLKY